MDEEREAPLDDLEAIEESDDDLGDAGGSVIGGTLAFGAVYGGAVMAKSCSVTC